LLEIALVHLGHQLQRAGQRKGQQRTAGLHDLARLHHAREHPARRQRNHYGLHQTGPGGAGGGRRQGQLGLRVDRVGALVGIGRALGARHVERALRVIQPGGADEALRHQLACAPKLGLGGVLDGIAPLHGRPRAAPAGTAQAGHTGRRLAFAGLGLLQRGPQLFGLQLHERLRRLNGSAFRHQHLRNAPSDGSAQFHAGTAG
jgi:hypothetical protein